MIDKTKEELVEEIKLLQKRIAEVEVLDSESKQQQQQRRLATVVRDSYDAITIQDFAGNIIAWNRGAELMYGYSEKEALGINSGRLTPSDKAAEQEEFTRRLIVDEAVTTFETQRVTKDGRILDVWLTVTKVLDDTGKPIGIATTERDITDSKHAREVLCASEGLFRGLFDNMTSGAAIYKVINDGSKGSDYIIRDFNAASLRIEGKRKNEVVGKSLSDLRPNIDQYGLIPILQKVWRTGEPGYFPSTIYIDEKYYNWYENRVFKLSTGEIVAIYDDVTERKTAETALTGSEEKFRTIFDKITDGMVIADFETKKFYDANQSVCRMLGYSLEEFKALGVADIHPKEDVPYVLEQIEKQSKGARVSAVDLPVRRKDGSIFYASVLGTRMNLMGREYMAAVFRDINERKQAEEALRGSEEYLTRIIDSVADPLFVKDREHRWMLCNKAFTKFIGHTMDELRDKSDYDFFPKSEADEFWIKDEEVFLSGGENVNEEFFTDGKGVQRTIVTKKTLYKDGDGKEFIVGIIRDNTEYKKAEKEMRSRTQELEVFYKASIGREERILELKEKIDRLNEELAKFKKGA